MEGQTYVAMTVGGLDRCTLHNAGAKDLAISTLEVLALQPPSVGRHCLSPSAISQSSSFMPVGTSPVSEENAEENANSRLANSLGETGQFRDFL